MRRSLLAAAVVLLVVLLSGETWAARDIVVKRNAAERFIVLPDGVRFPEGITANPQTGDLYVATFDSGPNSNKLLRFDRHGRLIAVKDFGSTPLLGLEFHQLAGEVYICNFGASKLQRLPGAQCAGLQQHGRPLRVRLVPGGHLQDRGRRQLPGLLRGDHAHAPSPAGDGRLPSLRSERPRSEWRGDEAVHRQYGR